MISCDVETNGIFLKKISPILSYLILSYPILSESEEKSSRARRGFYRDFESVVVHAFTPRLQGFSKKSTRLAAWTFLRPHIRLVEADVRMMFRKSVIKNK